MAISEDMAYKWNFIIKCFALMLVDFIGPLVAVLIYTTSEGIPGWTLEEFILFTGTITLVLGMGHAVMLGIAWRTIKDVRKGEFDKVMVKPMRPLLFLSLTAWDLEGFAEVAAGLMMIVWAMMKLWAGITFGNFMLYLLLLCAGFLFQYCVMVIIASIAFIAVKSFALFDLFWNINKFARWPLNVFGVGTRVFFTFIFPLAVAAHYPTTALLHGMGFLFLVKILLPVLALFGATLLLWRWAMKKYTSAGG
ncbi:ABC-2 family transporter protein [Candidatus Woesearchaeota archaeon]|nr:ABC-2 family transporter protein [Candidatus Woesearchaeota archaeon]